MNNFQYQAIGNYKLKKLVLNKETFKIFKAQHTSTQSSIQIINIPKKRPLFGTNLKVHKQKTKYYCSLNHHNLCTIYEILQDEKNWFLALENTQTLSFFEYLKSTKESRTEESIRKLIIQFICVFQYLKKNNFDFSYLDETSIFVDHNKNLKINLVTKQIQNNQFSEMFEAGNFDQKKDNGYNYEHLFKKLILQLFVSKPNADIKHVKKQLDIKGIIERYSFKNQAIIFMEKLLESQQPKNQNRFKIEEIRNHDWINEELNKYKYRLKKCKQCQKKALCIIKQENRQLIQNRKKLMRPGNDQLEIICKICTNNCHQSKFEKMNKSSKVIQKMIIKIQKSIHNTNNKQESKLEIPEHITNVTNRNQTSNSSSSSHLSSCLQDNESTTATSDSSSELNVSQFSCTDSEIFTKNKKSVKKKTKKKGYKKKRKEKKLIQLEEQEIEQENELQKILGNLCHCNKKATEKKPSGHSSQKEEMKNEAVNSLALNINQKRKIIGSKLRDKKKIQIGFQKSGLSTEHNNQDKQRKLEILKLQLDRIKRNKIQHVDPQKRYSPRQLNRIKNRFNSNITKNNAPQKVNSRGRKKFFSKSQNTRTKKAFQKPKISASFDLSHLYRNNYEKFHQFPISPNLPQDLPIVQLFNLNRFMVKKKKLIILLKDMFNKYKIKYQTLQFDHLICSSRFEKHLIKFEIKVETNVKTNMGKSGTLKQQNEKINSFMIFTNAKKEEAVKNLQESNWNLQQSLNNFYTHQKQKSYGSQKESESTTPKVSRQKIHKLFNKYQDKNNSIMNPGDVERFLIDCNIDPLKIEALILSWYFRSKTMGCFTRDEFCDGMWLLKCDSVEELKKKKSTFQDLISDENQFNLFYDFVFIFSKEDPRHKYLSLDISIILWKLILNQKFQLLEKWCEFLKLGKNKHKTISLDVWRNILFFSKNVKTIEDYDPFEAYPVLIDEFVEWLEEAKMEKFNKSKIKKIEHH
ncbi:rp42 related [Anaeramoeba flamelloides]|uniref:Defective in cullin neddylation protein n=1 Tax=Anaeramoeba flamelloides TaxID=1746091 RepID=A0ABQ8XRT2_9EUKA|nr:rp42 related [Anaeramoeba flamelloides]